MDRRSEQSVETFFEFSLLGLLGSGYLAVVGSGFLDTPTAVLTAAGLLLRALMAGGVVRLGLPDRLVTVFTLAYICFYPVDYLWLSGEFLPATVHLVCFLAVAKVLTARTDRDYLYVKVIAFLELLAASVLSARLNFFLFLALFLVFGVATFASSEIRRSSRRAQVVARGGLRLFSWRLAALTAGVTLSILTLTAGLFFLLPRTARAAFQHLVPDHYRLPGFSNEVMLGQIGEIKLSSTPVMHIRIMDTGPPLALKWRGAALAGFDGKRWFNPAEPGQQLRVESGLLKLADDRQRWRSGRRIAYEVQLKDIASGTLFFTGVPEFLRINLPSVIRTSTDTYRLGYGLADSIRYGGYSMLDPAPGSPPPAGVTAALPLQPGQLRAYLSLPALDPRIPALAREIAARASGAEGIARALEAGLIRRYAYTAQLPSAAAADPLADFLFSRGKGHCEYFASALAVMLRTMNIPSRVVTGFQSGVFNPISGWYIVRAADAHSWVEAYLPGRGWTTLDPTPPSPDSRADTLLTRLAMYLDAAETFWQDWVLSYDLDRQLMLAYQMEQSGRAWSGHWFDGVGGRLQAMQRRVRHAASTYGPRAAGVFACLALVWLAGPLVMARTRKLYRLRRARRGTAGAADAALLYSRMLELVARRGYSKPGWLTPGEFARTLPGTPLGVLVEDLTDAYNELRYGRRPEAAPRMVRLLDRLERDPGLAA